LIFHIDMGKKAGGSKCNSSKFQTFFSLNFMLITSMKTRAKYELEFCHIWDREYCNVSNVNQSVTLDKRVEVKQQISGKKTHT